MRNRLYLLLSLLLCVLLAGCTEDNSGTARNQNNGGGGSDAADSQDSGRTDAEDDGTSQETECQEDDDCTGNANQLGICDLGTNTCTYACDEGFEDCDGDASNGCEIDTRADADNCGACGNVCGATSLQLLPVCTDSSCEVDAAQCAEGYVDLNDDSADGCECEITEANDLPDADGMDTNCDQVDGIAARAIFVAENGDDENNDGLTPDSPLGSITSGIEAAAANDRDYLLVAGGTFNEVITLQNGISIYGGYDAANAWTRDTVNQTTRIAPTVADFAASELHYKTVIAEDIDESTTLDTVTIEGVDATNSSNAGASSYVIWSKNADALNLANSVVVAGKGAEGSDGTDATSGMVAFANGTCTAPKGGAGAIADASEMPCSASSYDGDNANSGADGELADISNDLGVGGLGGIHHCNASGTNGEPGHQGTPGMDGANGEPLTSGVGSLDASGHWTLGAGTPPTDGQHGGGGGGGGAGGNYETTGLCTIGNNCSAVGGNGGDGGDGGCAAVGSTNGQPGGGAFGVAVTAGTIIITDSTIEMGTGGNGGDGGDGAPGQPGAIGSSEGPSNGASGGHSGAGGRGAQGGNGGDAGAGAGGCGGASFGVVLAEGVSLDLDSSVTIDDSNASAAAAGSGGQAADGSTAPQGCAGEIAKIQDYTAD